MSRCFPASLRGIYAISPECLDTSTLVRRVEIILGAGICMLQYRSKHVNAGFRREQASALLARCREARVPLLINDDIDLALELGADGVHLGEHDDSVEFARSRLGPVRLIGASCYDSLELARAAQRAGADYVAFGAFHRSSTKPATRTAGLDLIYESRELGLPRVAIGGLRPDNIGPLAEAGVEMFAVVEALFSALDPAAAVAEFSTVIAAAQTTKTRDSRNGIGLK